MNHRIFRVSALLALSVSACHPQSKNSSLKEASNYVDPTSVKVLACESGDSASFLLKDSDANLQVSDFPALKGAPEEVGTSAGGFWTRLDACIIGDAIEVKRVLTGYVDAATVANVTTGAVVEGLEEAVFDQDYSKLNIRIPFVKVNGFEGLEDSIELFYMQGSKDGKAAVAGIAADVNGKLEYASSANSGRFLNSYQAGVLEYQEAADQVGCKATATASGTFTLGTATFSWLGKAVGGTSGGSAPILCQITVVDTAEELGANAGKPVTVEFPFDSSSDAFQYKSNHHSVCDSFVFQSGFATYAATANSQGFGGGSCPAPLKGAPKADAEGSNYIFTYGEVKKEGTQSNCAHPLRLCPSASDVGIGFGIGF